MASDAGVTPAVEAFILLSFCIPLAFVVGPILAWATWILRRNRLAVAALFLPTIPFVASIVAMANV